MGTTHWVYVGSVPALLGPPHSTPERHRRTRPQCRFANRACRLHRLLARRLQSVYSVAQQPSCSPPRLPRIRIIRFRCGGRCSTSVAVGLEILQPPSAHSAERGSGAASTHRRHLALEPVRATGLRCHTSRRNSVLSWDRPLRHNPARSWHCQNSHSSQYP